MKKIFGMFNSSVTTHHAVSRLIAQKVPEANLQVISDDPANLGQLERRPRGAPLAKMGDHAIRVVESNRPTASQLRDLGLPSESLPVYANHVRKGGVVLVVDADETSAETINKIIARSEGETN